MRLARFALLSLVALSWICATIDEVVHADAHAYGTHAQAKAERKPAATTNLPNTQTQANGDQPTSAESDSSSHGRDPYQLLMVATNIILAVATVAYVFVSAFILCSVNRQGSALIKGTRAWLMVEFGDVMGQGKGYSHGDTFARIQVVCRNDGQTPGWIESIAAATYIAEREDAPPKVGSKFEILFKGPLPVGVGKEESAIIQSSIKGSPGPLEDVFIYGEVRYGHPFGKGKTTFAFHSSDGPWRRLSGHPEHNANT